MKLPRTYAEAIAHLNSIQHWGPNTRPKLIVLAVRSALMSMRSNHAA